MELTPKELEYKELALLLPPHILEELQEVEEPAERLEYLMFNGTPVDPNKSKDNLKNPPVVGLIQNFLDVGFLDVLVKNGCKLEWAPYDAGFTGSALWKAASVNNLPALEAILKYKKDIDLNYKFKDQTAMWYAASYGFTEIVDRLCVAGCDMELEKTVGKGNTPFMIAISKGQVKTVEVLLKHGCRTDQIWDGYSAIFTAVAYKQYEVLEYLLRYGLSPEQTAPGKSSPLYEAAILGDVRSSEILLRYGANGHTRFRAHYTPFWKACFEGHDKVVELLIDKGFCGNVNRNTPSGTALWCAAGNGKDKIVEILLKQGADPEFPCQGSTPLQQSIKKGDRRCFELLVQYGSKCTKDDELAWEERQKEKDKEKDSDKESKEKNLTR